MRIFNFDPDLSRAKIDLFLRSLNFPLAFHHHLLVISVGWSMDMGMVSPLSPLHGRHCPLRFPVLKGQGSVPVIGRFLRSPLLGFGFLKIQTLVPSSFLTLAPWIPTSWPVALLSILGPRWPGTKCFTEMFGIGFV